MPIKYRNVNKTKTTYRPKCDNKIYHRSPNDWSYEIENKKKFQPNEESKVASQIS
jgi:hypothetical protein